MLPFTLVTQVAVKHEINVKKRTCSKQWTAVGKECYESEVCVGTIKGNITVGNGD